MPRFLSFFVSLIPIVFAFSQNAFQNSFQNTPWPSQENIRIEFSDDAGNTGYLPISILKGKATGPVFTMLAGVHGYEYPPIMAVQQLLQEIDPNKLSGTLIVVPIANIGSFFSRTPFMNPQDGVNLNNAFPGDPNGSITQKIAHFITENIIPASDVFLDIHGGDACEDLIPFVCYYDNSKKPQQTALAKELSEGSGFVYVVSYPYTISDDEPAKYAFKQAVQDGKTGLSIECGKLGNVQPELVVMIKNGVYKMLDKMKMYGKDTKPIKKLIRLNRQTYIKSNEEGIFYSSHNAGDTVATGDLVGYTTNLFGDTIARYTAPKPGVILYMLATPPINKGDTIMCIGSYGDE